MERFTCETLDRKAPSVLKSGLKIRHDVTVDIESFSMKLRSSPFWRIFDSLLHGDFKPQWHNLSLI